VDAKDLAYKISEHIFAKKGSDLKLLDLRNVTSITDYFLVCSADSDTQVKAIADGVEDGLNMEGIKCWHKEGFTALNWVLLDYLDVVVHIFKTETRYYYNLEKLWGDAPSETIEDPQKPKL
jgi:ribosome-associated protein